ncbi:GH1 family beta-glucosidase [Glaciibacter superstes]|uniref:GH1 family beta-glucosidase n=1 Tax=Glaciibacter superstes TaxID=501023 RepID=UPI0003B534E6|nr:GH1 family beta-glucosidase [Glaciibacter superstes]
MTERPRLPLPAGFGWGTATASYQIEGAVSEGGRGPSIWDTFSHTPDRTRNGDTGDVACDHYHRLDEDLDLLAEIGAPYYRFAPSWPRLQPTGSGVLNPEGVQFYSRMIDGLHARDIEPWITLYHWDLPQQLEDAGGWPARATAEAFAKYAGLVYDAFGDRVRHWTTLNEPWCSAFLGYGQGVHAPGRQDHQDAVAAGHHLLLGHGLALRELRSRASDAELGITLNLFPAEPESDSPEDVDCARRIDGLMNRFFLDPVFRGTYPDDVVADLERAGISIPVQDGDLELISAPLDLLGVNYYTRFVVRARSPEEVERRGGRPSPWPGGRDIQFVAGGLPTTEMRWEVYPEGLSNTLHRIADDYTSIPIWITESGSAFGDVLLADGTVDDQARIDYLDSHIRAALEAREAGVDLRGYFVWSLLDNFEWAFGYEKRFGIYYVDYETQERTPKASAIWLRETLADDALPERTSA